jgi:membrane associated rhomboid family serine protease
MSPQNLWQFNFNFQRTGVVTKSLCVALLAVSLGASLAQRYTSLGIADLNFRVEALSAHQFWRLATYPFVQSTPLGLIFSLVVLWFFGRWFESSYGARNFSRFFALSAVGAALIAVPLSYVINLAMPFRDMGLAEGPGAVFDAMLVALALTAPDSNILFGFVLPVRARTVIWLVLAFDLIAGIQTGAASLSITLGGMAMGYLLVSGNWRPARLADRWARWRRIRSRRRGLYVVPPRDDRHSLN